MFTTKIKQKINHTMAVHKNSIFKYNFLKYFNTV